MPPGRWKDGRACGTRARDDTAGHRSLSVWRQDRDGAWSPRVPPEWASGPCGSNPDRHGEFRWSCRSRSDPRWRGDLRKRSDQTCHAREYVRSPRSTRSKGTARDAPGCATARGCAPPGLRSGSPLGDFAAGLGSLYHSSSDRTLADRAHPAKASRERNSEQRLQFYLTSSINIIEYQPRRHQDSGELASRSWRSRSAYRILKLHDGFIVLNHYGAIPFP